MSYFYLPNTSLISRVTSHSFSNKLSIAQGWQLLVDLGKQLGFLDHILMTNLNPDIVIFSKQKKTVMSLELRILWKENIEATREGKMDKYQELVGKCWVRGW